MILLSCTLVYRVKQIAKGKKNKKILSSPECLIQENCGEVKVKLLLKVKSKCIFIDRLLRQ